MNIKERVLDVIIPIKLITEKEYFESVLKVGEQNKNGNFV